MRPSRCLLVPLVTATLTLACAAPGAEAPATAKTAPSLDDDARLAISEGVRSDIENGEIAGAVIVVAGAEQELLFETYGSRRVEELAPMMPDTIFRIHSMTKPITSVAVMMLAERGALDLDDPVGVYLPELADLSVGVEVERDDGSRELLTEPADRPVTIRDLLRHTSGFTYGLFDSSPVDTMYMESRLYAATDLADMMARLGGLPLKHHPGVVYEYSVSTDVLGRVVEVVSGQSFDAFLQEHVFDPLGMVDTGFWVPEDKTGRFAGYYRSTEEGLVGEGGGESYASRPGLLSGGGGLVSTAFDYLRFCRMILGGGELDGVRILSPESVAAMGTDQLADLPGADGSSAGDSTVGEFGLGFAITPEGDPGPVPGGVLYWFGYASTGFWIDPGNDLIGLYLVQKQPFDPTPSLEFRAAVYQALGNVGAAAGS